MSSEINSKFPKFYKKLRKDCSFYVQLNPKGYRAISQVYKLGTLKKTHLCQHTFEDTQANES